MEEKLDKILSELKNTNELQKEFSKGQRELTSRMGNLEIGQKGLTSRMGNLEIGQKELTSRMKNLETGQIELTNGQRELTSRMENLEAGQTALTKGQEELTSRMEKGYEELKDGQTQIIDIIKHTAILLIENVTSDRKDLKTFQSDVNSDINLLFNEVESVKRKVNKLEQSNK
jgi:peptidoglycan hydrolase CwlO-like protein